MIEQTRIVIINVADRTYTFCVHIHRAQSPAEQLIEADFYKEFAQEIYEGVHYEMELVESSVYGRVNSGVPIHIHENPDSKCRFICFTGNIKNLQAAVAVLRTWCVGTVYTITHNKDFGPVAQEAGADFIQAMRDRCGIVIFGDMEILKAQSDFNELVDENGITPSV